jgi:hypothetical protein
MLGTKSAAVSCARKSGTTLSTATATRESARFLLSHVACGIDRLCGLVVRVPGYKTEMYCVSYEVRTEFICVM